MDEVVGSVLEAMSGGEITAMLGHLSGINTGKMNRPQRDRLLGILQACCRSLNVMQPAGLDHSQVRPSSRLHAFVDACFLSCWKSLLPSSKSLVCLILLGTSMYHVLDIFAPALLLRLSLLPCVYVPSSDIRQ